MDNTNVIKKNVILTLEIEVFGNSEEEVDDVIEQIRADCISEVEYDGALITECTLLKE